MAIAQVMCNFPVLILLVLVAWSYGKAVVANHTVDAQDTMDKLVDTLTDQLVTQAWVTQALKHWSFHHKNLNLDNTLFAKPGNLPVALNSFFRRAPPAGPRQWSDRRSQRTAATSGGASSDLKPPRGATWRQVSVARQVTWRDIAQQSLDLIPPLDPSKYKGQAGRVAVLGGSEVYTGAPYYAASAALRFGADLATVFCAKQAAIPIKSYSPELMVQAVYDADETQQTAKKAADLAMAAIRQMLPRLHVMVVGPGLGRSDKAKTIAEGTVAAAIASGKLVVIDADGLYFVEQNLKLVKGCKTCILTPNIAEFRRLVAALRASLGVTDVDTGKTEVKLGGDGSSSDIALPEDLAEGAKSFLWDCLVSNETVQQLRGLHEFLGEVPIVVKGAHDLIICNGKITKVDEEGSPRRCGGQGDVLAGTLGVAALWAMQSNQPLWMGCALASCGVRRAARLAFSKHGRGMTAVEVLAEVGPAFQTMEAFKSNDPHQGKVTSD